MNIDFSIFPHYYSQCKAPQKGTEVNQLCISIVTGYMFVTPHIKCLTS